MNDRESSENRSRQIGAPPPPTLRKELNLLDGIAIVVGTIIGSGIFLLPSSIAAQVNSFAVVLLVWVLGGVLTIFGSLCLAELGAMYPSPGGLCTYLWHAYGPFLAFLYAWALLFVIHSGSIAALAVAFGLFAGQVLPVSNIVQKAISVACILSLTTVSCLGIRGGKLVQNTIAVAKIGGLAAIIVLLGVKGSRPIQLFETTAGHDAFSFAGFGLALVAVLWGYEGWHVMSFAAGEMKKPRRDLPRSLFLGSVIVMLIFILANLGYYKVLSPDEIRGSNAVAAVAVGKLSGPMGAKIISALILVSILGSMNGLVLTGPRAYYAMAREGIFPRPFMKLSTRFCTPIVALLVQGVWAAVLAVSGSYQQLFTDVIFTAWIFYGLSVGAVLLLRRTQPRLQRPFLVPGYPWVCLLFCIAAAGLVLATVIGRPMGALIAIGMIAIGATVYFLWIKGWTRSGRETSMTSEGVV